MTGIRSKLLATGINPSIDAIRAELGTGSKTTIHRYLKEIEEEEGGATGTKVAVSEAIQDLVGRLAARLNEEADARSTEALAVSAASLAWAQKENTALKAEGQTVRTQLEQAQRSLAAEKVDHTKTQQALSNKTLEVTQLNQRVMGLQERLDAEERHRQSLEEKHQHAREAFEHFRNSAKEQREQEQRQHDQLVQYLQSELRKVTDKRDHAGKKCRQCASQRQIGRGMSHVYEAYKPLRNRLRKYNLAQSLTDVWTLSDHLANRTPLPRTFGNGQPHWVKDLVQQWDLAILTREIVLNASPKGTLRLNNYNSLASVMNRIRDVENAASGEYFRTRGLGAQSALASLYATVHRQFPWQRQMQMTSLMRYMKVFGAQAVETVLMQSSGLSIRDWYLMGMAISGHMLREPGINAQQDLRPFGIPAERTQAFFEKLSMGIEPLRQKTQSKQLYDENWLYSWNPIEESPLIAADPIKPHLLYCPIPELVFKRFSQGLFYDLKDARGYENPYGHSFQAYIGDVIHETFQGATYELQAEASYRDGRNQKHGVDWILMDPSANLFIECKTKRVKQTAKMAFDLDAVQDQFEVLAKAIVQLYKNIADAQRGITHWVPNSRPIHPLVVTLEDWYLFGSPVGAMLKELVLEKLQAQGMDTAVLDSMPYTVVSSGELEAVGNVLAQVGIQPFLEGRHKENFKDWLVQDYAQEVFPDACQKAPRILFRDNWVNVIPEISGNP